MSLFGLWLILASPSLAQPAFDYHESFARFDQELKAAIKAENVAALALLVKFPLHVNHADGSTTSLDGPRALQAQFAEVFTPEVRQRRHRTLRRVLLGIHHRAGENPDRRDRLHPRK